jgi:uncharacterized protein (DUF362 family)/GNAT superfamily N-acetyltransferase
MGFGVTLKKGKLSSALKGQLDRYYRAMEIDAGYAAGKWERWRQNGEITVYVARQGGERVGWSVYDPARSTIEEILTSTGWSGKGIEPLMVDAMVRQENLIAAEVVRDNKSAYRWMVEYGFRPTRAFVQDGFPMTKLDLSIAVLMKKVQGTKPARPYRKKERVAIERVPPTQTDGEIRKGLENVINKLGGIGKYVKPGQTVVIKPNIVADHGFKDGVYTGGIVTDIRVIRSLVEMLLPIAGTVIIAEGSSINRSETAKMFAHYGYDRLVDLDPRRVSLLDLNTDEQVEKPVPGGKRMLSRKIPVTLEKADVIINVPVLKLHFAAVASLAVKSLQGAVPPLEKYMTHFFGLWQNLVNIHRLVQPKLTIIDGLTGQEDFGPVSGRPKKMDLLIGGTNPVAIDAVAMRIMGLEPLTSPPVLFAYMQGLGPVKMDRIHVMGLSIEEVASPFVQPEINVNGGRDIAVCVGDACPGCTGYLHFGLTKLRRPDPKDESRLLMDRPFHPKVNFFLGPETGSPINCDETNVFMGICQQHNAEKGTFLPGCPPHAEVILNGIFSLFPDVERPKYADKSEEERLEEMLKEVLRATQQ